MNYQFFSNIFRALMCAEGVAVMHKDELLLAQVKEAKASILTQFDHFFPSKVEDVLNRPGFSCKPFFDIIADFPFLIKGREKKFLKFVASVAHYAKLHRSENIALGFNTVRIMVSPVIDDFVWNRVVKDKDSDYFVMAVNAVLPLVNRKKKGHAGYKLIEELLPSWVLAFPEIVLEEPEE